MSHALRRAAAVLAALWRLGFAEAVAYRAAMLVWILSTSFPLISLALWVGLAREGGPIGGYGEAEFVAYFVAAFLVRQLTACWVVWDLERSIRLGEISVLLLRPVHPIVHHLMTSLAALPVRLVLALPLALGVLVFSSGAAIAGDPLRLLLLGPALVGGWLLNFAIQASVGALAFWWDRSSSLYEIWSGLFVVLSGYLVPTSLLPEWLAPAVRVLPFHAILGFPVELLVGSLELGEAASMLALQWSWVALAWLLQAFTWRRGIRAYGAFGA